LSYNVIDLLLLIIMNISAKNIQFLCTQAATALACLSHHNSVCLSICLSIYQMGGSVKNCAS